jgi:LmbE family N-acetylglucosaminyl deacetylase
VIPRSGIEEFRRRLEEAGEAPDRWDGGSIMGVPDEEIDAVLDVKEHIDRKREAFRAHVTQNDPSSFFLNTPDELLPIAFGLEFYTLARGAPPGRRLSDLFEGLAPQDAG